MVPIIFFAGLIYLFRDPINKNNILGSFVENGVESPKPIADNFEIESEGQKILVHWFEANPDSTFLIPNFEEKLPASEAKDKYQCDSLVSGGFYSKEDNPIGLFQNDDGSLGGWQKNDLLNGIFSINHLGVPRITRVVPKDILRIGLQSGPILKENGSYIDLQMRNDSPERRVVVFTTGENRSYFAIFYDPESNFLGPTLEGLPSVLKEFEAQTGIKIADALNLDGGSASSFYHDDFELGEISYSGSFFCVTGKN